jgi:uncharacterized Tic20 family protein
MIKINCPKCQNIVTAEDDQVGESVSCPKCGNVNIVPTPWGETPVHETDSSPDPTPEATAPPAAPAEPAAPPTERDIRIWAMLCHLSALAGYIIFPIGWIVGPLVVWLMKKDQIAAVDREGRKALNYHITIFVCTALIFPLTFVTMGLFFGTMSATLIALLNLAVVIYASVKTHSGEVFRYPFSIKFFSEQDGAPAQGAQ